MSRKPRLYTESGIYHVILRGNNQQNLFYDNEDRYFFRNRMKKYARELKIEVYCYCLMSNHIHLLIKTECFLSLYIQKMANSYVYYFNRKYGRSGHLFQGRFKSEPVDDDIYFKTVLRYIIQNPSKAGLSDFKTYKWSNYAALIGNNQDGITDIKRTYEKFGNEIKLTEFLAQYEKKDCMEYENKHFLPDSVCVNFIRKLLKSRKIYDFYKLNFEEQKESLKILRDNGFSINQLSRITGINKRIIKSA